MTLIRLNEFLLTVFLFSCHHHRRRRYVCPRHHWRRHSASTTPPATHQLQGGRVWPLHGRNGEELARGERGRKSRCRANFRFAAVFASFNGASQAREMCTKELASERVATTTTIEFETTAQRWASVLINLRAAAANSRGARGAAAAAAAACRLPLARPLMGGHWSALGAAPIWPVRGQANGGPRPPRPLCSLQLPNSAQWMCARQF